jgi:general secretion pathway protein D
MSPRSGTALLLTAALALAGFDARAQSAKTPAATNAPAQSAPATQNVSLHEKNEASKAFLEGAKALKKDDLRTAEKQFERATKLDPGNADYSTALTIAREHLLTQLVQEASKARLTGHDDTARSLLAQAYLLDPNNPIVEQHVDELAHDTESQDAVLLPSAEEAAPPVHLAPKPGQQSFHLRRPSTEVLRQVLAAFEITPLLDSSVKSQTVRFDADDVNFTQAEQMLKLSTGTFFVPLDQKRVLIAQDTKENRAKFERQVMETIYLPGLTNTEMSDMGNVARNVFEAQQATVQAEEHTLTVRAPGDRIDALNNTFADLLDGRSEILLTLKLYEIDRTRTTNIGAQLPQTTSVFNVPTEVNQILNNNQSAVQQIIAAGLASPGDNVAIVAILVATGAVTGTVFNQPFALFGGGITESGLTLNQGATANFSLNSSDARMLDQVQLRVLDQEDATFRSGTRYPIVTSTYSGLTGTSLGIGGISTPGLSTALQNLGINSAALQSTTSQTIPQVQYEDLGLTLKATPHILQNKDVTLKIDLKIESLSGQTLNSNPVLNSRQYQGSITLLPGESSEIVTFLTKQQSAAVTGVPGLSELPGFQSTTNKQGELDSTDLVITITPHIVRLSHTKPASRLVMLPAHP